MNSTSTHTSGLPIQTNRQPRRSSRLALRPAVLLLAALAGLLLPVAANAQETCTSSGCHAKLTAGGTVHAAAEACDSCHEATSATHPQPGKPTFKLTAEPPALCNGCHDAFGTKKHVHSPVAEGMCTTCHDPHSSAQAKLLVAPPRELCANCHSDKMEAPHLHGPVSAGDCTTCHAPHEADLAKLLTRPGDELCFSCHGDIKQTLAKPNVHPALESGCTSCHNPHGAAQPTLLAESGAALCYQCHDAVAEIAEKSAVRHAALQDPKACTRCHSPHASTEPKLLLASQREICGSCHGNVLNAKMTTLHGPINDGKCAACHLPHGSGDRKLLSGSFPVDLYVPYTDKAYGLCFTCHSRDLLQYPDTSFATNFRNGERNLHYVHVNNAQKGRSCRLCHTLHGGGNDRLIADSVPFGSWTLPLKFVRTETGGGCSPGCHKPYSYDRKEPVKN